MALPSTAPPDVEELQSAVQSSSVPLNPSNVNHYSSSIHLTASSQSWFPNASNFEVKDSQFTNIANANVTINNDPVSTILWSHVAAGAIFNSATRYAAGKCHPGTRKKIIDRIVDWINDPDPTKSVLWIYGPAGAGKSAIAQTICELLKESHPDNDGGSFFFSSGHTDCGNAFKLFTTLSYQLAIQFPSIRAEINSVLSRDPSLPTKSMEIQLFSLIVQPLLQSQTLLSDTPVLIIDGLDECANDNGPTQGDIVALISKCLVKHNVPLRFLILSRPEYWIRDAFDTPPLPNITLSLSLRDDLDADKDIKAYLTDEFERIRAENKRFMSSVILPWPPAEIIDHLVYEASGQYIYAATVLKFVGKFSKFSNPQKQLEIIISPGPHRALAFSELDRLYATILSAYPQWETMKRVLAALLLDANKTIITVFLGVELDELALVLDALSSLIEIIKYHGLISSDQMFLETISGPLEDGKDIISFYHRSFREFLGDKTRSREFYIDPNSNTVPEEIIIGYFDLVHRNLEQNYKTEPHIFSKIDLVTYTSRIPRVASWSIWHCTSEILLPLITNMAAKLHNFHPGRLAHVHSIFYFIHDMELFHYFLGTIPRYRSAQQRSNTENPRLSLELITACQGLQKGIYLLRQGAIAALASCKDFKVTSTLVYLTEYWFSAYKLPLSGLRTIAGVTDVISSLKQHHYCLLYRYNNNPHKWNPTSVSLFHDAGRPDWRNRGAWRDLRILFTSKVLKSILEFLPVEEADDTQYLPITAFFDSKSISDIGDKDYFENTSTLAILAAMTDLAVWVSRIGQLDSRCRLPVFFLVSILSWFNRQLNYDTTLQQKMTTVMKYIFKHGLLQPFTDAYRTSNYLKAWGDNQVGDSHNSESTSVIVWPLHEGAYKENIFYVDWPILNNDWQPFHDEVFGNMEQNTNPIIHRSEWHPHLITRLLIFLVKFLYGLIHQESEILREYYHCNKAFSYITQCLPYAHHTSENLDALRMIVYLYPQVTPTWNPPEGLWPSLAEFIQKYDPSILSSEEKQLFLLWLNSKEHAEIKTYMGHISTASPSALERTGETESTAPHGEGEGHIESV